MVLWCVIRFFSIGLGLLGVLNAASVGKAAFLPPLVDAGAAECWSGA